MSAPTIAPPAPALDARAGALAVDAVAAPVVVALRVLAQRQVGPDVRETRHVASEVTLWHARLREVLADAVRHLDAHGPAQV